MRHWTKGQVILLWFAGAAVVPFSFVVLGWLVDTHGYSTAQLQQIELWWFVSIGLLGLVLFWITWRWLGRDRAGPQ